MEGASSSMSNVQDIGSIKRKLFDHVRNGKWQVVRETYKKSRAAHEAKITSSGHTALHLAVSNAKPKEIAEDVVEELVGLIKASGSKGLIIQDERGYTALHFAAVIGNVRMCKCIAGVDSSLVGVRNNEVTRIDEADGLQNGEPRDIENARGHPDTGDQGHHFFPKIYAIFWGFLKPVVMAIVVIFGYGDT